MELKFNKTSDGTYEAIFESDVDVKLQLIFAEGLTSTAKLSRSLDGEHYDLVGISRDSNCPILQSEGASAGDKFKVECFYEPESSIIKEI